MREHIIPVLDITGTQTVNMLIQILKRIYGRTRMENLEELIIEWLGLKVNNFDNEDKFCW